MQMAGSKIASHFLRLFVYWSVVGASSLITCAIITSHTLLPCDLTLVDFGWLPIEVAFMSRVWHSYEFEIPRSRGNVDVTMRGWPRASRRPLEWIKTFESPAGFWHEIFC